MHAEGPNEPLASEQTPAESDRSPDPGGQVGSAHPPSPEQAGTPETATRKGPSAKARARAAEVREIRKAAGLSTRLDPIEKARRNPKSLRLAINAKCFDCEGGNADPCVQWRIGNCDIERCPLHPVRPYQHMEGRPTPKALQWWGELEA